MTDALQLEIPDLPIWARRLAVFDLETTGLVLTEARVVTACVAEINEAGVALSEHSWLANPGIDIPEAASRVHGITNEIARDSGINPAQVIGEITERIASYLSNSIPVVVYNAPYDLTILHHEALRHGIEPLLDPKPIIDPLVLDKYLDTYRPGKRTLEATARVYGVKLDDAHNASADALAAGRIAQQLARKFPELANDPYQLHVSQVQWSEKQDDSYEEFRRKSDPNFSVVRGWPLKL